VPSQRRRSAEFLDPSECESRDRLETTFGARAIVPGRAPKTSVIRLTVQISHSCPIHACQKSTLIPMPLTLATVNRPGKTSIGGATRDRDNAACVRRAHVIPPQKAQSGFSGPEFSPPSHASQ